MTITRIQEAHAVGGASLSFATLPTAGNTVLVGMSTWTRIPVDGDVTDNQGNTYSLLVSGGSHADAYCAIFACSSIGTPSGTFTISYPISGTQELVEYSGLAATNALDQTSAADSSATMVSSQSTGTTGLTAQDIELAFAVGSADDGTADWTWTVSSGWSLIYEQGQTSQSHAGAFAEQFLSVIGTQSATFTTGTVNNFAAACLVTLKAITAALSAIANISTNQRVSASASLITTSVLNPTPKIGLSIDSQETNATGHNSTTSPLTWSFTNNGGNLLLVGVEATESNAPDASGYVQTTAVSYGGDALTEIGSIPFWANNGTGTGFFTETSIWYRVNPKTGSNTVSVTSTLSSTNGNKDIIAAAISFKNADTTSPLGSPYTAKTDTGGGNTTATVVVPNTIPDNIVVAAMGTGTSYSSTSNFLSASLNVSSHTAGDNLALTYQPVTSSSTTMTDTVAGPEYWGIIAVEVKAQFASAVLTATATTTTTQAIATSAALTSTSLLTAVTVPKAALSAVANITTSVSVKAGIVLSALVSSTSKIGVATTGARRYQTSFPATENPISESGSWVNGGTTGLDWTNMRTTPGKAFTTQPGNSVGQYDDSLAIVQNGTWGNDQAAEATVYVTTPPIPNAEVELLLRFTISPNRAAGYEFNAAVHTSGVYMTIVRWDGGFGLFTNLASRGDIGVANGDVIGFKSVNGTLSAYKNNVLVLGPVTDTTFVSGAPGIGGFLRNQTGNNADFGLTKFAANDAGILPSQFTPPADMLATATITATGSSSSATPSALATIVTSQKITSSASFVASASLQGSQTVRANSSITTIGTITTSQKLVGTVSLSSNSFTTTTQGITLSSFFAAVITLTTAIKISNNTVLNTNSSIIAMTIIIAMLSSNSIITTISQVGNSALLITISTFSTNQSIFVNLLINCNSNLTTTQKVITNTVFISITTLIITFTQSGPGTISSTLLASVVLSMSFPVSWKGNRHTVIQSPNQYHVKSIVGSKPRQ